MIHSFRLLTELYSFLHQDYDCIYYEGPFQVSVSLRSYIHSYKSVKMCNRSLICGFVSVSLRSYIHSYSNGIIQRSTFKEQVSVSLRSYIHSYPMVKKIFYCNIFLECYRVIFLFLKFFCLFQLKASLTPYFLNIV